MTAKHRAARLRELHEAWMKGDQETVNGIEERLMPVHDALFCESSPDR